MFSKKYFYKHNMLKTVNLCFLTKTTKQFVKYNYFSEEKI